MKRKKKGLKVYRAHDHSWFGDQLLKVISVLFGILFVGGIIAVIAYQGLSRSVFFQVEVVDVKGCSRTTPQEILSWSGLDVKTNLWKVRIGKIRKALESHHWIATAVVKRNWPNKLAITIKERKPFALLSVKEGLYYIDREGVIYAEVQPADDKDFPVITGLEISNLPTVREEGQLKEPLDFIMHAEKGTVSLPKQNISEIHITPKGDMVLFMADHAFPIYLGRGEMRKKYSRLSTVLSWLYRKEKYDIASSIDANYVIDNEAPDNGSQVLVHLRDFKPVH